MIKRTVYECEYCRSKRHPKRLLSSYTMYIHECSCFYNPKNHTCLTCKHNTREHKFSFGGIGCADGNGGKLHEYEQRQFSMTRVFNIEWNCANWEHDGHISSKTKKKYIEPTAKHVR